MQEKVSHNLSESLKLSPLWQMHIIYNMEYNRNLVTNATKFRLKIVATADRKIKVWKTNYYINQKLVEILMNPKG